MAGGPKMFDVVQLQMALPENGLVAGDQGTVVDAYPDDTSYTVEFMRHETTIGIVSVRMEDVVVIWSAPPPITADVPGRVGSDEMARLRDEAHQRKAGR